MNINLRITKIYPSSIYYDKYENSAFAKVLLGFGGLKEIQINEGIQLLKEAWFSY